MKEELDSWWNKIKEATGYEQRNLFVRYCSRLVELKEEGKLSEEEAAYQMVGTILNFDNLAKSPECDAIFNIAGTTELPRITSYVQPIGKWDQKTADRIKQEEWEVLIAVIEDAKTSLKIS